MNRRLLLPGLLLAHAAALSPLLFGPVSPVEASPAAAITVIEVAGAVAAPVAVFEPTFTPVAVDVDAPQFDIGEAAPTIPQMTVAGTGCGLSDTVQTALRSSPGVQGALALMPADARSVADAALLWDGRWIDARVVGGNAALVPIQNAVAAVVRAAATDCRNATITGPRLIYVSTAGGTRVLAFGSGSWTWSQVLGDSAPASAAAAAPPPASEIHAGRRATIARVNA